MPYVPRLRTVAYGWWTVGYGWGRKTVQGAGMLRSLLVHGLGTDLVPYARLLRCMIKVKVCPEILMTQSSWSDLLIIHILMITRSQLSWKLHLEGGGYKLADLLKRFNLHGILCDLVKPYKHIEFEESIRNCRLKSVGGNESDKADSSGSKDSKTPPGTFTNSMLVDLIIYGTCLIL